MSSSGMDDIADGTSSEVEDQKDQTRRAVKESMQNYGDRREEEGKKKVFRRAFGFSVFSILFGSTLWFIDDLNDERSQGNGGAGQNGRTTTVTPTNRGVPLTSYGAYNVATTLQQSHTGDFPGITKYIERDSVIKEFSDNLRDASLCDTAINNVADDIYNTVRLEDQEGNSRGGDYRLHVGPTTSDATGFHEVDLDQYFQNNRTELSEDDWRDLSDVAFSEDDFGIMYLSDTSNRVVEDTVAVLDEEETYDILEGVESENPGQYRFSEVCG